MSGAAASGFFFSACASLSQKFSSALPAFLQLSSIGVNDTFILASKSSEAQPMSLTGERMTVCSVIRTGANLFH